MDTNKNVVSVLTFKTIKQILDSGGSQSWVLVPERAEQCQYAVLCRNVRRAGEGGEPHGTAFLVGRVKEVVPSTEKDGRWLILFSEYAMCDIADQWEGRNPVRYWTTSDYNWSFDDLDWQPMPTESRKIARHAAVTEMNDNHIRARSLTIHEAKAGLALGYGVDAAAVEIVIRG